MLLQSEVQVKEKMFSIRKAILEGEEKLEDNISIEQIITNNINVRNKEDRSYTI